MYDQISALLFLHWKRFNVNVDSNVPLNKGSLCLLELGYK